MSKSFRLFKSNVLRCINPFTRNGISIPAASRFIYSDKAIGMDGYENQRLNVRSQFMNVENVFRTKMEEVCQEENTMVFTEDLKAMLHLVQKNSDDLDLLNKMMHKFNMQNKELRFGAYIFGPVVMRTYYYLDEPDKAVAAFKDPALENFFDQFISYQILLNLLFKHERYAEMREIYDIIKTKYLHGLNHPRNCSCLVMAACYKENTPEAFTYAVSLWKELRTKGDLVLRKTVCFLAALAVNQNAPEITIEILTSIKDQMYITVRCLKLLAYLQLNRYTEILTMLRKSLETDRPGIRKQLYFNDVIQKLQQKLQEQSTQEELSRELLHAIEQLGTHDYIMQDRTLDEYLLRPVQRRSQGYQKLSQHDMPRQNLQRKKRQGLRELL